MTETESGRLVCVQLDDDDIRTMESGETLQVECPVTGETIYFGDYVPQECECCGQEIGVEDPITPSWRGLPKRLRNGGTAIYDSVHNEDDITLVIRAAYSVCDGWE